MQWPHRSRRPTKDIICKKNDMKINAEDELIPTWFKPRKQQSLSDNHGTATFALYAWGRASKPSWVKLVTDAKTHGTWVAGARTVGNSGSFSKVMAHDSLQVRLRGLLHVLLC